jgi:hypothetical protein
MKKLSAIAGMMKGLEITGFKADFWDEGGDKLRGASRLKHDRVEFIVEMKQPGNPDPINVYAVFYRDERTNHLKIVISEIVGLEDWASRQERSSEFKLLAKPEVADYRVSEKEFYKKTLADVENLLEINMISLWKNR